MFVGCCVASARHTPPPSPHPHPTPVHTYLGPRVRIVVLLDALTAAGQPEDVQDAVVEAMGEHVTDVPLSAVKGILTGAGIRPAAAARIVAQLV
jgi:hypothetical protein